MVWPNSLTSFTLKKYSLCLGLDFQILPEGAGSAAEMAGPGQRVREHVRLETHAPSNGRHPRTERRRWVSARPATGASPPQPSVMLERRGQNREVPAGPSPGRELTRALGARRPTPTAVRSRRHPRHPSARRKRHDRTRGSSAQRPSSAPPVTDERTLGSPGRCNGKSHTPRKHRCQTQHQEPKPEAAARRAPTAGASVAHWPGLVAATKYTKRRAR